MDQGGTGIGYWSPATGEVAATGLALKTGNAAPAVFVYGPFVLLDKGFGGDTDTSAIVVDTRTGGATGLARADGHYDRSAAANAGVLALDVWIGPGKGDTGVSVLGRAALPPLTC